MKKILLLLSLFVLSLTLTSCFGCDHSVTEEFTVESTCLHKGYTNTKCKVCNYFISHQKLELGPHKNTTWKSVSESTCITEGKEELICDLCNIVVSEKNLPTVGHTPKDTWDSIKNSTCVEDGILGLKCKYCNEILEVKEVAAHHTLVTVYGRSATCTNTGLTNGEKCSSCQLVTKEQTEIAKKNHTMITAFSGEKINICSDCNYTSSDFAYFATKSDYSKACAYGSQYSGGSKKIIIKLSSEYDGYSFEIGSNITQVVFTGVESTKYNDIEINVLNRSSSLTIDFENVSIISNASILTAPECNEKITVRTHGSSNSFYTRKASNGTNGSTYFDKSAQVASSGTDGGIAADVFSVKGSIEFVINASTIIKGGDGGNGGNGGSLSWIVVNGGAGRGGNGGNGGDAISAGGTITVTGKINLADFRGGKGGKGGKGGYNEKYSSYASDGTDGTDGKSGLE